MTQKLLPGPVGTSCLTCKRRHKKCDQQRPVCKRCEEGGFECLGYSHNMRGGVRPMLETKRKVNDFASHRTKLVSIQPKLDCPGGQSDSPQGSSSIQGYPEGSDVLISSSSGSSVSPELCLNERISSTPDCGDNYIHRDSTTLGAQNNQPLFATNSAVKHTISPLLRLFAFYSRIPYSPPNQSMAFLNAPSVEDYILSHCDRTMKNLYFKPPNNNQIRQLILSRLNASSITRWIMFLSFRIHESYLNGDTLQNQTYSRWLEDAEYALRSMLTYNLESHEAQDRLGDWLGVLLLKVRIAHASGVYMALKNATPTFLQLAFSIPNLWPADSDSTSIPLTSTIISPRHELSNFALVDSVCAMAFGLPQQVEYDTSLGASPLIPNHHESLLSFPTEFQVTLTEINACRDKSSTARDWREIEHRLMTWEAQSGKQDPGWESWMVVAWLAVQESWRHTLLTYLYMAVCGASSDDPRVQTSVCQIFRVTGTVKKQESSSADVPFFIQYLIAGICARSERHRKVVREELTDASESKIWLMRGVDFVPVLDHLWHGAAANGQPIGWGDYMRSRETMLPIAL